MTDSLADQRQCPTRTDGRVALFTHRVNESECQSRQRGMFHRCFTCAYNNSWVARNGLPAVASTADQPTDAVERAGQAGDGPRPRAEAAAPVAR